MVFGSALAPPCPDLDLTRLQQTVQALSSGADHYVIEYDRLAWAPEKFLSPLSTHFLPRQSVYSN